jgi:uncharacterized protein
MTDYYSLIAKYFPPDSPAFSIYLPHVILVTNRALVIARRLSLSQESIQFIEDAGLLHDIGICRVNDPEIGCHGELPYVCHGVEGRKILESEGIPTDIALVAERHTGVGISRDDIRDQNLPLPDRDLVPLTVEEKIIAYADKFYSKDPGRLWEEKTVDQARNSILKFGEAKARVFDDWHQRFEG